MSLLPVRLEPIHCELRLALRGELTPSTAQQPYPHLVAVYVRTSILANGAFFKATLNAVAQVNTMTLYLCPTSCCERWRETPGTQASPGRFSRVKEQLQ